MYIIKKKKGDFADGTKYIKVTDNNFVTVHANGVEKGCGWNVETILWLTVNKSLTKDYIIEYKED